MSRKKLIYSACLDAFAFFNAFQVFAWRITLQKSVRTDVGCAIGHGLGARLPDGSVRITTVAQWSSGHKRAGTRKIRLRGDVPYDRICVNLCVNNI